LRGSSTLVIAVASSTPAAGANTGNNSSTSAIAMDWEAPFFFEPAAAAEPSNAVDIALIADDPTPGKPPPAAPPNGSKISTRSP